MTAEWGCRSIKKRQRLERFHAWCEDEDAAMFEICTFLSGGDGELKRNIPQFANAKDFVYRTLFAWLMEDEDRKDQIEMAKRIGADKMAQKVADVLIEIAATKEDQALLTNQQVTLAKAKSDAYKWMAGCVAPTIYGNKIETTIKGDKDNPIQTETKLDVSGLSDEQLKAIASIKLNSD